MHQTGRHIFDRCGLAALSDLRDPATLELMASLEREQTDFLAKDQEFRSAEYKWPRDPLHWWSRIWEYPYAYHHLTQWRRRISPRQRNPVAVDVGSGVTFFPFSVARLGYDVVGIDVDAVCQRDLARAAECIEQQPGSVRSVLAVGDDLPLQTAEADVVYCISVLEHVPRFERTISEIARVLRPGAQFILTIDLAIEGDAEIGAARHASLIEALGEYFCPAFPDVTVHPANALYSTRGPFPYNPGYEPRTGAWPMAKRAIKRLLYGPSTQVPLLLAVQGLVMNRHA